MQDTVYFARMERLKGIMAEAGIDCLLVTPSSNMIYLCDYAVHPDERFLSLVLAPGHEPFIIANALYELQVAQTPVRDVVYWKDGEDPFTVLEEELDKRRIGHGVVAVDGEMPAYFTIRLMNRFKGCALTDGSELIRPLRVYKDKAEVEILKEATARGDRAFLELLKEGPELVGKTERQIEAEFIRLMSECGITGAGSITAAGAHAAIPHHVNSDTVVRKGDCLILDFGGRYKNYYTDCTRTIFFGTPDNRFSEVYQIVQEANLAGEAAARTGNRLCDVDRAARGVIEKAGYGKYFTHRTGHGIGIDVHEGPSACEGEETEIRAGMAFSCEPGIYLPGEFGVRIEDEVLIDTEGNTLILHKTSKELTVIDC